MNEIKEGELLQSVTLRDWLAGMAMQAFVHGGSGPMNVLCRESYKIADAMIAERDFEQKISDSIAANQVEIDKKKEEVPPKDALI